MVQVTVRVSDVSTVADEAASLCAIIERVSSPVALNNPAPVIVSEAPELVKVTAQSTWALELVPVEFVHVASHHKGVDNPAESAGSFKSVSSSATAVADSSRAIYLNPESSVLLQTVLPDSSPPVLPKSSFMTQFSPLFTITLSPCEYDFTSPLGPLCSKVTWPIMAKLFVSTCSDTPMLSERFTMNKTGIIALSNRRYFFNDLILKG